jgi:hypothetical protein
VVAFMSVISVSISLVELLEVSIKLPLAKWMFKWKFKKGK